MEEGCINDIKANNLECSKLLIKNDTTDLLSTRNDSKLGLGTDIIPDADITYSLGTASRRFKELHLSPGTLHLGDQTMKSSSDGIELDKIVAEEISLTKNNVKQKFVPHNSLGVNHTFTMPQSLPSATRFLKCDTSGNFTFDNIDNIGIGTFDTDYPNPISPLQIQIDPSKDATDSSNFDNYSIIMSKVGTNATNAETGLCFDIQGGSYPKVTRSPGAAITHERTNGWSKGKLHFKTKQTATEDGDCVTSMTINEDGNVGIGTTTPITKLNIHNTSSGSVPNSNNNNWNNSLAITGAGEAWDIGVETTTGTSYALGFFNYNNTSGTGTRTIRGYILGTVSNVRMNFTGQHRSILNKNIDKNSVGLIVSSNGKYININNSLNTNINESLPICSITNIDNDTKVFGVISDKEDTNSNRDYSSGNFVSSYEKTNKNEQRMYINSLGEGAIWVCNKNDILVNGDYISSSSVIGYGQKQILEEGTLKNFTVAKITCDCDFSLTKIVKQKLKVITTTETYEENVTQDVEKTTTETKIEYDNTLSRYIEKQVTTTTTENEQVYDTFDLYDSSDNILLDSEGNARTHQIERKETKTKIITNIDYDSNGDVQYEDDLDADGNQQMINPFETRFLQADGTQITETEYNTKLAADESVYIACFVGCTYHCG